MSDLRSTLRGVNMLLTMRRYSSLFDGQVVNNGFAVDFYLNVK